MMDRLQLFWTLQHCSTNLCECTSKCFDIDLEIAVKNMLLHKYTFLMLSNILILK